MISKEFIQLCKDTAYNDSKAYGVPSIFQIDYTVEKALYLADKLNSDKDIVLCGAYLMDCMLGTAYANGKLSEHVTLSYSKAEELFENAPELTLEEKSNILHCIGEHHGIKKFYSLESEICANADCYKFLSVKGVIGGIKYLRDMEFSSMVSLYKSKLEEKLAILSLPVCISELEKEINSIREFLVNYK